MRDYQAVLSSHEISKKITDLLEDIDPIQYNGSNADTPNWAFTELLSVMRLT